MNTAYISLGSNLGNRAANLREALSRMEQDPAITLGTVSPLYETVPVGGPSQGPFLNACAAIITSKPPAALLRRLLAIEKAMGRVRLERWGARTVDLDLLLYGNVIMRTPVLELPHPRLAKRGFVLKPLSVIAPDYKVPGTGKTVRCLLEERPPTAGVQLYQEFWYHR